MLKLLFKICLKKNLRIYYSISSFKFYVFTYRIGCGAFNDINCRNTGCLTVTVAKLECREYWPPTEDGGGAASAERKADRPVQLEPDRPAQPASPGVQPWAGA